MFLETILSLKKWNYWCWVRCDRTFVPDHGYDPAYGARPLMRAIQRELENPIATLILEDKFAEGSILKIGASKANGLTFKVKTTKPQPIEEDIVQEEDIPSEDTELESAQDETTETETAQDEATKETVTAVSDA